MEQYNEKLRKKMEYETKKQEIFNFIKRYIAKHVYPPSYMEISHGTGIENRTVRSHVKEMIDDGILVRDSEIGGNRAYRIPGTRVVITKKKEENKNV